ncbi:TraB/GumN family protein [Microbulbifer halophilus]|uniref:TraB/GumN family protein n=1 Tax=Microbulbifer halophilus TaxID=453963 RepID=A0ABW5EJ02_9GAMM|nr:TraB/GumN family protein [Microbulbifer halophilus]MCW8128168.1 TraB/GumN family protein [Microbulbifer halophilus]
MPTPNSHKLLQILTATLLLCAAALANAANDRGVFWHAEKGDREIYLLGSVHLASADFYPLRETISNAYHQSDVLVVEADVLAAESDTELQQQIMQESLYRGDRNLKDDLSSEVYAQLQKWLQKRQVPEAMFVRQRPAIAMVTMSMVEMKARGLDPSLGIDRHFLERAKKDEKTIIELEGVLSQLRMLNSLEKPDLLLQQTLEELREIESFLPQMTGAWKSGDSDALYRLIIADGLAEHPEYAPLYESIFFKRNRDMAEKIGETSEQHPSLFAIVGAGHLVGDKSVLKKLAKQGFELQQL